MNAEVETLYKEAEKAEKSRDFETALEYYQKIISLDSQEEQAYYGLANIYAIRGLVPQVVQQYLKLVDVLEAKGQLEGAVEVCQWIISIEPTGTQARTKLIELLEKQSKKDEAIQQSLILARIFSALGHGEQSIELLQKQREMDPDNPELILQLGEVYIKQGQIPEGIALYKTIAQELLKREDYNRALDVLRRIKSLRPEDLENITALGEVYLKLGKLDEAKAEFRSILRQDLNHIGALTQLGMIAKMQGAWDEARLPFRKIVELDPNNAFAQENFAEVNEFLGNQPEAIKHYLLAAEVYEKSGQTEKSIEIYQNILALDPTHGIAKKRLEALGAPVVAHKKVIDVQGQLARSQPSSRQEKTLTETETEFLVESQEDAGVETREGKPSSKLILKPGLSEKKVPFGAKAFPSIKPTNINLPAPTSGGVQRTKPPAKPILTRLHDQTAPPTPLDEKTEEMKQDVETKEVQFVQQEEKKKPRSLIQELEFSPTSTESQANIVYVDQTATPEDVSSSEEASAKEEMLSLAQEKEASVLASQQSLSLEVSPRGEVQTGKSKEVQPEATQKEVGGLVFELPHQTEPVWVEKTLTSASGLEKDVEQLISQGKVDVAIRLCKEALKEPGADRSLKALLGEIYATHGLLEEAYAYFKEVGQIFDAKTLGLMAETALFLGKKEEWEEAMLAFAAAQHNARQIQSSLETLCHLLAFNPRHVKARKKLIEILKEQSLETIALYHSRQLIEILESMNALDELILVYKEILESRPHAYPIRYKLALCYQEMGKVLEAKQEFVFLSTYFAAQGEREKEVEYLERALSLDSSDEGIMQRLRDVNQALGRKEAVLKLEIKLGDVALAKGHLDSALASYQKVLEVEPENLEALARLVELYIKQNNSEQALLTGKKLGNLYIEKGDFDKAITLFQTLLKLNAEDFSLHRGLAMLYSRKGQTKEAIQEFMTIGRIAENKALFDDAIDAYRQVLSLDGAHKDARYQLGVILADHKNNWDAALAEFKKVRGLDPQHSATLSRLAKGYAAQGKFEEALPYVHDLIRQDAANKVLLEEFSKELELQLQKDPENGVLHFNYGILCREMGNFDQAIKEFQFILRKSPALALRAYVYQGLCWEEKAAQQNDGLLYQTALKVYRKGLELHGYKDEEYLELKYALARLYETMGKLQDAISLYQEIISVDMEYNDARARKAQLEEEISSGKVTRLPYSRRQESS
jgi:tetratricopeptide (TPR) repeat protein